MTRQNLEVGVKGLDGRWHGPPRSVTKCNNNSGATKKSLKNGLRAAEVGMSLALDKAVEKGMNSEEYLQQKKVLKDKVTDADAAVAQLESECEEYESKGLGFALKHHQVRDLLITAKKNAADMKEDLSKFCQLENEIEAWEKSITSFEDQMDLITSTNQKKGAASKFDRLRSGEFKTIGAFQQFLMSGLEVLVPLYGMLGVTVLVKSAELARPIGTPAGMFQVHSWLAKASRLTGLSVLAILEYARFQILPVIQRSGIYSVVGFVEGAFEEGKKCYNVDFVSRDRWENDPQWNYLSEAWSSSDAIGFVGTPSNVA